MAKLNLVLLLGWTFDRDLADRAAKFVKTIVEKDHNIRVIGDPLGNKPDQQQTPATISSSIVQDASFVPDGFIFVSTEHNGCIPPSLTTVLYQHGKEYFCHKPSLIVVYSEDFSSAGRAAKLLRSICGELGCCSVKKIFALPEIQNNLDRNGVPCTDVIKQRLEKNLEACLEQLYWTATAFKEYRTYSPEASVGRTTRDDKEHKTNSSDASKGWTASACKEYKTYSQEAPIGWTTTACNEHRTNIIEAPIGRNMPQLNIVIFLSSTRDGRLADRVLKFIKPRIEAKFDIKIHDPLAMPYPLLRKPVYDYKQRKDIPRFQWLAQRDIDDADGFVFISTEYHSDIPAALTNMTCHFPVWNFTYKPSAIITYSEGHFGGVRASLDLRTFSSELGCGSVPATMTITLTQDKLDENGVPVTETIKSTLENDLKLVIEQLEYHARALKTYRSKVRPPSFSHPTRG